jgi:hypothetical protein
VAELRGTVERGEFAGAWQLVTPDGTRYALDPGRDRALLEEGKAVVVEGTITDSMGIGMDTEQAVKVKTWREKK